MDGVGLKVFKFFQLLNMGFLKGKYSRYFAPSRQHIITPSYNINNTSALIVSLSSHIIGVGPVEEQGSGQVRVRWSQGHLTAECYYTGRSPAHHIPSLDTDQVMTEPDTGDKR